MLIKTILINLLEYYLFEIINEKKLFNINWGMKSKSNMNQIKQRNQLNFILSFQFKLSWIIIHFYSFYNSYYWVIFSEFHWSLIELFFNIWKRQSLRWINHSNPLHNRPFLKIKFFKFFQKLKKFFSKKINKSFLEKFFLNFCWSCV